MLELFQYNFFVNAVIASVLASVAFGIVGTYVVVKRIVFISGGISHTAFGGIGLGYLLGFNPIIGAFGFSIGAASFISVFRRNNKGSEDSLIGIMWAFGMALGILFTSLKQGYTPNLMSYLFGNILTIPRSDVYSMLILDTFIVAVVTLFYKQFQAVTFDEEFARTQGLPVDVIYTLLLIIIALTTVMLIKLVGIILVIAMLSIPASIAINYVKSIKGMMLVSVILGIIFTLGGLLLSYYLNLASGATIIMVSVAGYLISKAYNFIAYKKLGKLL